MNEGATTAVNGVERMTRSTVRSGRSRAVDSESTGSIRAYPLLRHKRMLLRTSLWKFTKSLSRGSRVGRQNLYKIYQLSGHLGRVAHFA